MKDFYKKSEIGLFYRDESQRASVRIDRLTYEESLIRENPKYAEMIDAHDREGIYFWVDHSYQRVARYGCDFDVGITLKKLVERDGEHCAVCGVFAQCGIGYSIGHIVPMSKGGPHTFDNVQVECVSCNFRRGASLRTPEQLKAIGDKSRRQHYENALKNGWDFDWVRSFTDEPKSDATAHPAHHATHRPPTKK